MGIENKLEAGLYPFPNYQQMLFSHHSKRAWEAVSEFSPNSFCFFRSSCAPVSFVSSCLTTFQVSSGTSIMPIRFSFPLRCAPTEQNPLQCLLARATTGEHSEFFFFESSSVRAVSYFPV